MNSVMKYHEFNGNAIWKKANGEEKQVSYLVMELLEGVELLEFIKTCEILEDNFIRYIFLQVGATIHQLHQKGIAHRDIKLENLMITKDFEIKLIDFGYALVLEGRDKGGYMKSRLGTPMYMAPEIFDK